MKVAKKWSEGQTPKAVEPCSLVRAGLALGRMFPHPVISQHLLTVSIQEDTICLVFARASSGCQQSSHEQAAVENSRGP